VLKAIIQQVDRRAEVMLRKPAADVPIGPGHDDRSIQLTREHERLVAGTSKVGAEPRRVAHHYRAVHRIRSAVAAAENRRRLPHFEKQPRNRCRERRLPASA
jgi:hypothetical protein